MPPSRHATNPAKVKADYQAMKASPTRERILCRTLEIRRRVSVALLCLLSVAFLTISFAPFSFSWCAYFALVPWSLAMIGGTRCRWTLFWSYLTGLVFWGLNLYWLWWVTLTGYFALIFYLGFFWLVAGLTLRAAAKRRWPIWLVLPVVWVALEYLRAYALSGFPWFMLAHSQWSQTPLIQITDITGQYGVSFFVAMINGALVELLACPLFSRRREGVGVSRQVFIGAGVSIAVLAGMLVYGYWRLDQTQDKTRPGPVIGVVQQAFPIALGDGGASREKIFEDHIQITRDRLMSSGADLIIWPETMLPHWLNDEILNADLDAVSEKDLRAMGGIVFSRPLVEDWSVETLRSFLKLFLHKGGNVTSEDGQLHKITPAQKHRKRLSGLVNQLDAPLLAGGTTGHPNPSPVDEWDRWVIHNSALWFNESGELEETYAKRHPVPFSEMVPFKRSWPWFYRMLRKAIPPGMPQLEPGTRRVRFALDSENVAKPYRLAPVICYEGVFARVCRDMVMDGGTKRADMLINMSNDGWFVWRWGDRPYRGSTEHMQHMVQYVFRAIENRTPVIRSVNTGISASIDSAGRLAAVLQLDDRTRTMIPGTLLLDGGRNRDASYLSLHGPRVLVDDRVSLYSVIGDAFAILVSAGAIVMIALLLVRRRKEPEFIEEQQ